MRDHHPILRQAHFYRILVTIFIISSAFLLRKVPKGKAVLGILAAALPNPGIAQLPIGKTLSTANATPMAIFSGILPASPIPFNVGSANDFVAAAIPLLESPHLHLLFCQVPPWEPCTFFSQSQSSSFTNSTFLILQQSCQLVARIA